MVMFGFTKCPVDIIIRPTPVARFWNWRRLIHGKTDYNVIGSQGPVTGEPVVAADAPVTSPFHVGGSWRRAAELYC